MGRETNPAPASGESEELQEAGCSRLAVKIWFLLREGHTERGVATLLEVSVATVRRHRRQTSEKLLAYREATAVEPEPEEPEGPLTLHEEAVVLLECLRGPSDSQPRTPLVPEVGDRDTIRTKLVNLETVKDVLATARRQRRRQNGKPDRGTGNSAAA